MHLRLLLFLLGVSTPLAALAQLEPGPAPEIGGTRSHLRTEAELDELLGPIALYPDALIALILPAATSPSDVVLLARQLATGANLTTIDQEDWDDSVKALARYPEVVKWMDENLGWTRRVGEAFEEQPTDVMNAVQRLRTKARAAGTLNDTPQQQVVVEEEEIRILPARPDVIYVPRYDPVVVYVERPYAYTSSFITFGIGYPVGYWLAYDCDWRRRSICYVPPPVRVRHWHESRDWRYRYRHDGHRDDRDRWHVWNPRSHSSRRWDHDDRDRSRRRDDDERGRRYGPPIATAPDVVVRPGQWTRPDFNGDRDESRRRHDQRVVGDPRPDRPVTDYRARRQDRDQVDPNRGGTNPWRRGDNRNREATPGGTTPTVVAPVSPVPDIVRPAAPMVSPNGRRMPGGENNSGGAREYTRSPTGRVMSVQSPSPPPREEPRAESRFQRAEAAARGDSGGSRPVRTESRSGGGRSENGRYGARERD